MLDARAMYEAPLSEQMLFDWHLSLLSWSPYVELATWRMHEEPMQIVSGREDHWKVHFEAPPSKNVPVEMKQFINWFNESGPAGKNKIEFAPVRAAIAQLYFESIHPFEDGNGRIGRAIAEKALSQGFGYPIKISLSQAIELDKKAYYSALNQASKSNEITAWIYYFVKLIVKSTDVD